jgi:predicted DNA-binding transcriptional regulator AlpA
MGVIHDVVYELKVMHLKEICDVLAIADRTARRYIRTRRWDQIPPPMRLGGKLAWHAPAVEKWLAEKAAEADPRAVTSGAVSEPIRRGPGRPRKVRG